ncbi:MAG: RhoGEF domain-containing protein [Gammaproteobacteria bacterium]
MTEQEKPILEKKLLEEMSTTEKTYLENLKSSNEALTYLALYLARSNRLLPSEVIFVNKWIHLLETLITAHKKILEKFEDNNNKSQNQPETFIKNLNFISASVQELEDTYAQYMSGYSHAFKIIEPFTEIAKSGGKLPETVARFSDLLITPVQRLPRYLLLFAELEKNTPKEEQDKLKEIGSTLNKLKESTSAAESKLILYQESFKKLYDDIAKAKAIDDKFKGNTQYGKLEKRSALLQNFEDNIKLKAILCIDKIKNKKTNFYSKRKYKKILKEFRKQFPELTSEKSLSEFEKQFPKITSVVTQIEEFTTIEGKISFCHKKIKEHQSPSVSNSDSGRSRSDSFSSTSSEISEVEQRRTRSSSNSVVKPGHKILSSVETKPEQKEPCLYIMVGTKKAKVSFSESELNYGNVLKKIQNTMKKLSQNNPDLTLNLGCSEHPKLKTLLDEINANAKAAAKEAEKAETNVREKDSSNNDSELKTYQNILVKLLEAPNLPSAGSIGVLLANGEHKSEVVLNFPKTFLDELKSSNSGSSDLEEIIRRATVNLKEKNPDLTDVKPPIVSLLAPFDTELFKLMRGIGKAIEIKATEVHKNPETVTIHPRKTEEHSVLSNYPPLFIHTAPKKPISKTDENPDHRPEPGPKN